MFSRLEFPLHRLNRYHLLSAEAEPETSEISQGHSVSGVLGLRGESYSQ